MKRKRKNSERRQFSTFEYWLRGGDEMWTKGYAEKGRYFVPMFERQDQLFLPLLSIVVLGITLPFWFPFLMIIIILADLSKLFHDTA